MMGNLKGLVLDKGPGERERRLKGYREIITTFQLSVGMR